MQEFSQISWQWKEDEMQKEENYKKYLDYDNFARYMNKPEGNDDEKEENKK